MIDVGSYWVCACQRPLTSGTKVLLVVNSFTLHLNAFYFAPDVQRKDKEKM